MPHDEICKEPYSLPKEFEWARQPPGYKKFHYRCRYMYILVEKLEPQSSLSSDKNYTKQIHLKSVKQKFKLGKPDSYLKEFEGDDVEESS
ncbi:4477_t:CDS:2 [Ambispora gerdemannii]|uniref:4477_t:CDS:1 n=1 Tax=Ambispora gerdemannii TaxID=144530 RepID=A0A9N9GFM3_9GLOM|nr:4477_t:CDS:2 [Ambispora gerdemannii]